MIKTKLIYVILAITHLLLVNIFIWTNFENKKPSGVYQYLRIYRDFAGCFRDYTYFAPNIANDTRAGFIAKTTSDSVYFLPFRAENKLVNTRYNNLISSGMRNPKGRDLFARSWATLLFGQSDSICDITVFTEAYIIPTIQEYRNGMQPSWNMIYMGRFEKEINK
ncbi:hypothetical protein [Aquimarina pacifica]|uniref:hypothetical protein n=1 Tax=Aquimarina pacifica TaxID=1296415 RepID=UPI00047237B8|nr:hypothetical protein [Aquimarina pacifica]